MKIRTMVKADLPQVSKLAAQLVRLHHGWDTKRFMLIDKVEEGYHWFLDTQLDEPSALLLVAETDSGIIGYLYGSMEERNWNLLLDPCGAVNDVFVDPAKRKGGVATALMTEAFVRFKQRGAPRVVLMSAQANVGGQSLFEKLGFRRTMIELTREL
jgi:ribosomal protein S18 acetylase RimI-like enzyme